MILWSKRFLPLWEKYGAKHIGLWNTSIGDNYEIVRLFAYDDFAHLERFNKFLAEDKEGQKLVEDISSNIVSANMKILRPVGYSPLQ